VTVTLTDDNTAGSPALITAAQTFTITIRAVYTVTPIAYTGGSISPVGAQLVPDGDSITFTMTPDTLLGYYAVSMVKVDAVQVMGESNCVTPYTITNVQTNRTIEVYFEDHGSSCSSATPIAVAAPSSLNSVWGDIFPAGDFDYFKVVIPATGIFKAYTTGTTDTFGYLLDSGCNIITYGVAINDDISGQNSNFKIVVLGITPGTYYIAVKDYFEDMTGDYKLWVSFEADDHGSSCDEATPISCGGSATGEIVTDGDMDYFEVHLAGDGILTAYTTGMTDTRGILLNSNCTEIDQQDFGGTGNNFKIQRTLDQGTYYIAVRHSSSGTGPYTLYVTCQLTYDIYANAEYGGVISPSGTVAVGEGGSQTFIITSTGANNILEVKVDDVVQGAATGLTSYSYTFTNVTSDHTITVSFDMPSNACLDISEIPLDARFQAAPANIMFVLDDSGSMDWEFLTTENDGTFSGYYYVFDNPGDNLYSGILPSTSRMKWKSQWAGYNRMYYDPTQIYDPWPTLSNANVDTPRSHPTHTTTFNINNTYRDFSTGASGVTTIIVDNQDANFTMSPVAVPMIIDDEDVGFTKSASGSGNYWDESTYSDEAYNGDYWRTADNGCCYNAAWKPPAGTYTVDARWHDSSYICDLYHYPFNRHGH